MPEFGMALFHFFPKKRPVETFRSRLYVDFRPVHYDFDQEHGRKFAASSEEDEVLPMNLDTSGLDEYGGRIRFFESNQIGLVVHPRLISSILKTAKTDNLQMLTIT